MKDESSKRLSKLKAFARDALSGQDNRDSDYYKDDDDSYEKIGSKYDGDEYEDSAPSSYSGYSSYSSQSAFKPSYSPAETPSDTSFGYSSSSADFKTESSQLYRVDKNSKFRLSILRLEKLDDAVKVADEIMSGNTITLVDLRCVQKDTVRRIIDFLDGVRYTCEAKMEIVADYTYVVVPRDVELTGDLFSQLDTGSLS